MAERLTQQHEAIKDGLASYPVLLPYAIAETVKGYGFPGAGTNAAHNLPLPGSGATDELTRTLFNEGCAVLHVPHLPSCRTPSPHCRPTPCSSACWSAIIACASCR
jgi:phosphoketolase